MGLLESHRDAPHKQCKRCNKITGGPFKDANPGRIVTKIDEEGMMGDSTDPQGRDANVSHTLCEKCGKEFFEELHAAEYREPALARAIQRPDKGIRQPVPLAHEPIAEAHTPIPAAYEPAE